MLASTISLPAFAVGKISSINTPAAKQGVTFNKIKFEKLTGNNIPRDLLVKINKNRDKKGAICLEKDGYIYIAVLAGNKSTAGYGIEIVSVEDNGSKTNILVNEFSPAKGSMQAQIITYPYVVIRAKRISTNITVKDKKGLTYPIINDTVIKDIVIYSGKINTIDGTRNIISININGKIQQYSFNPKELPEILKFQKNYSILFSYKYINSEKVIQKLYYNIPFEIVNESEIPQLLSEIKGSRGYKLITKGNSTYVAIASGKKNTGGYSINVSKIELVDGNPVISVNETSPDKDSIVTQAFTYPICYIKIMSSFNTVAKVVNQNGEEFKNISLR